MSKGIVDRSTSMPLSRAAVLAGRTAADLARNVVVILVMIGVGYAVGFRFTNGPGGALLAIALLPPWGFTFSWVGVPRAVAVVPADRAGGVVPDDVPAGVRVVHLRPGRDDAGLAAGVRPGQPDHPVTDSVRALALGEPFALLPDLAWAGLSMAVVLLVLVPLSVLRYRRS